MPLRYCLVMLALLGAIAAPGYGDEPEAESPQLRQRTSGRNRGPADPPPALAGPLERGRTSELPGGNQVVVTPGSDEERFVQRLPPAAQRGLERNTEHGGATDRSEGAEEAAATKRPASSERSPGARIVVLSGVALAAAFLAGAMRMSWARQDRGLPPFCR